jgi:hypothetical protein
MPGQYNSSSIEGGIFAEVSVQAPVVPTSHASRSSIEGGIFGSAPVDRPTSARNNITKSSLDGGLFGGAGAYTEPDAAPSRSKPAKSALPDHIAGMTTARDEPAVNPLQQSLRVNPNRSSVEGGIFGPQAPAANKAVARVNPNTSSIPGGIFG